MERAKRQKHVWAFCRLKRKRLRTGRRTIPIWVTVFYRGKFRRIKKCRNENEALIVVEDIAERMKME